LYFVLQQALQFFKHIFSWFLSIFYIIFFQIFTLVQIRPASNMVRFTSVFTCLALALATSAAPLVFPLGITGEIGETGQSLSISADGKSITVDGKSINLSQLHNASGSCKHGGGKKHGKGGASSNSTAAASAAPANAKAIYFMTNAANNSIVALKVAADGTLSDGSITATGGAGMSGVDSTGAPAAPDSLFSQGSVKVAGNVRLYFSVHVFQLTISVLGCRKSWLKYPLHVQHLVNRPNPAHPPW
jgi:hypothetical protein